MAGNGGMLQRVQTIAVVAALVGSAAGLIHGGAEATAERT